MKRILLVSNMYPSKKHPNYGTFVKNSKISLQSIGFVVDAVYVTKSNQYLEKLFKYLIYYVKIMIKVLSVDYAFIYIHYASHNAPIIIMLSKLKKLPKIITNVHGSDVVPEVKKREKMQPYVKRLLQISYKIVTPSNYFKGYVANKYALDLEKIVVSASGGIDPNIFFEISSREKRIFKESLGINEDDFIIGYIGRVDYKKGWDVLLKALNIINKKSFKFKLIFVGDGPELNNFWEMLENFGFKEHVLYFQLMDQKKLRNIYNILNAFIFPTLREGESLGLVGLEAMACGTPVIGSNFAGLKDYIVDGHNGLFFDVGDFHDLSEKIFEYSKYDLDKIKAMKDYSLITSKHYLVERINKDMKKLFEED